MSTPKSKHSKLEFSRFLKEKARASHSSEGFNTHLIAPLEFYLYIMMLMQTK